MNSSYALPRARPPRAAFGAIFRNEVRLVWRQPAGAIAAIGISLLIMVIFGELPVFKHPSSRLDGLSPFQIYIPILISFSIGLLALIYLPGPLVSYREQGILRRLSVTPVPASWVLAAQLAVQACVMIIASAMILTVSIAFFGQHAPANPGGFLLALLLSIAASFAIGLCIAAVAPTSSAVRGIGAAVFYPLVFFSGLFYPVQLMPSVVLDISHFTPLGAAVQAIVYPIYGQFPPTLGLLVLAAYALVFGFLAKSFFRWE
ncbi:MAG: ABC transporter permease [Streptosporangiaceae bacterium]|jgi:ABC-2 type transport system permease protein